MELQEYFDKTVDHLRSGQGRAIARDGACMYRTSDGKKCAVGVHIPDDHEAIINQYEGTVRGLINKYPGLEGVAVVDSDAGLAMALDLQDTHDAPMNWDGSRFEGETALKLIADGYELTYTPPVIADGYGLTYTPPRDLRGLEGL